MKIEMMLDNTLCTGTINRFDLLQSLFSMFLHFNHPDKWIHFKIKNIKGHPEYEKWKYIYCDFSHITFKSKNTLIN